ncbi:hypothetical protein BGX34_004515, partial [Mortierella sp. NVP85]
AHSIWFMVDMNNSKSLEELWHTFQEDLELENYLASIEHLAQATFPILVHKQQKGSGDNEISLESTYNGIPQAINGQYPSK